MKTKGGMRFVSPSSKRHTGGIVKPTASVQPQHTTTTPAAIAAAAGGGRAASKQSAVIVPTSPLSKVIDHNDDTSIL